MLAHFTVTGLFQDPSATNQTASFFVETGNLEYANLLLKQVKEPTSFLWNTVIRGFEQSGNPLKSIHLYHQMLRIGSVPDKFTFPFVLKACTSARSFVEGEQIHCLTLKIPLQADMFVQVALIVFYARCGEIETAHRLFDRMHHRNCYCWNALIDGYVKNGDLSSARLLFDKMPRRDLFTWNTMIDGNVRCGQIEAARELFAEMPERDIVSWNSMIHCYAKFGILKAAFQLFNLMEKRDVVTWSIVVSGIARWSQIEVAHCLFEKIPHKNIVSWNSLIDGYTKRGDVKAALILLETMEDRNTTSYNIMLDAYSKCGEMETARELFEKIDARDIFSWNIMIDGYARIGRLEVAKELFDTMPLRDLVSWNTLVAAYKQSDKLKEAVDLFHQMQISGAKPDEFTLATILSAVADLGSYFQGRWIHTYIVKNEFCLGGSVGVALIDMYSKCGHVDMALKIFDYVTPKTIDHWNSMISGLALHGYGKPAIDLVEEMIQAMLEPDAITFVGILTACSHAGFVHEGKHYFELMSLNYGITPKIEHYGCMVDLLGRAGHLEDAWTFVMDMPLQPNGVIWRALLSAARNQGNVEIGEHAAKHLIELDPHDTSSYVLLSNIYGATRRWGSALEIRKIMKETCLLKAPGFSSIELNGFTYDFTVGDATYPEITEIHLLLNEMIKRSILAGYAPLFQNSLLDANS